ncbi:DUF3826 domain-containing protein [Hymenobacter aerilatus]|uniref:DUF3826 domain-containing protein n=1 Tax=Hymenobacter aerilatus TaxID=2932251 RepID=A0A8T9SXU1_9BACT|nr:DUF3826 domain-containing protein [Hymenobacter aerilatus]UOR07052.1 DUF3826 domain-containing protein [Hymenobacter aerilatus]
MKLYAWSAFFALCLSQAAIGKSALQPKDSTTYQQIVAERAHKIAITLDLTDPERVKKAEKIIAKQYIDLRQIHDARDKQVNIAKTNSEYSTQQVNAAVKKIEEQTGKRQDKLHEKYLAKLSNPLSPAQVDKVKDGMTYNALPITYRNYLAMIPDLSEEQKVQIKAWLTEAREHAMDGGSSKEKLGWFEKYKGKITNYLTAAHYDLKKLEADWLSRTESQKATHNKSAGNAESVKRAQVVLDSLKITDGTKRAKVQALLTQHFDSLNSIFQRRKSAMQTASQYADKELANARGEAAWSAASGKLNKVHAIFLGKLSTELSADNIEKVKDVMTEGGCRKEYKNYLALFPGLNPVQRTQVWAYLTEARDNAMNAESADVRKQWFIKYRGRANNFLSAAGYDLRKATEDLEKHQNKNAIKK